MRARGWVVGGVLVVVWAALVVWSVLPPTAELSGAGGERGAGCGVRDRDGAAGRAGGPGRQVIPPYTATALDDAQQAAATAAQDLLAAPVPDTDSAAFRQELVPLLVAASDGVTAVVTAPPTGTRQRCGRHWTRCHRCGISWISSCRTTSETPVFAVTLGILTAIGGFVDIGDLVANSETGARFGMRLAVVVVIGVIGICVYAEMCGRVAAISGRPVFDLVRERLGPQAALANLAGSYLVTLLTLGAEIGGVALAIQLASSVSYLLWVPVAAFAIWVALWRVKFETLERVFGLVGLALVVFVVALVQLDPDWAAPWPGTPPRRPRRRGELGHLRVFRDVAVRGRDDPV